MSHVQEQADNETISDAVSQIQEQTDNEVFDKYQLPLKNTRGIPLRRYDLELRLKGENILLIELLKGNYQKHLLALTLLFIPLILPETVKRLLKVKHEERQ